LSFLQPESISLQPNFAHICLYFNNSNLKIGGDYPKTNLTMLLATALLPISISTSK